MYIFEIYFWDPEGFTIKILLFQKSDDQDEKPQVGTKFY